MAMLDICWPCRLSSIVSALLLNPVLLAGQICGPVQPMRIQGTVASGSEPPLLYAWPLRVQC